MLLNGRFSATQMLAMGRKLPDAPPMHQADVHILLENSLIRKLADLIERRNCLLSIH